MAHFVYNKKLKRIQFTDLRFYMAQDVGQQEIYLPSVTTILNATPKPPNFYEWLKRHGSDADTIMAEAMEKGSTIHGLTERYDNGEEVNLMGENEMPLYSKEEWQQFIRYVEFSDTHKPKVIENELTICLASLGFGGTIDRVMEINGETWLIDLKTGNVYEYYFMQLAAYKEMYEAATGKKIDNVGVLHLNAKTRGADKKGVNMQGYGWCIETPWESLDYYHKAFYHTKAMWEFTNKNMKPNNRMFDTVIVKKP